MLLLSFEKPNLRMFPSLRGVHVSQGLEYLPFVTTGFERSILELLTREALWTLVEEKGLLLTVPPGEAGGDIEEPPEELVILLPCLSNRLIPRSLLKEENLS